MRDIIKIAAHEAQPDKDDVLEIQGIPAGKGTAENVAMLYETAMELFFECAQPVGIISNISISEFEVVYKGESLNETSTPLDGIFRKAESLALFAVTLGENVIEKIDELFKSNEFALASMLDSAASAGTEKAADITENYFLNVLFKQIDTTVSMQIVRYSPGYCGWHVSGQKKLFAFLRPEDIGITLLDSFLMKPLKSISGVLVAGEKEIHLFEDTYPFCSECKTHSCQERMRALLKEPKRSKKKR